MEKNINIQNEKRQKILKDLYENPESISSFSGVKNLYNHAKKYIPDISLVEVKKFLKSVDTYTLHKLTPKRFPTQKIIAAKPKIIVSLDLIDMSKLAKYNNGVKFLMYFIDVYSKKITVIKLKNKNTHSILEGLKYFFELDDNWKYSRIYSDFEASLYSKQVKDYLKKNKKIVYSNSSVERKNSISESNLKTLKYKIYKYLTHYNTYKYIDVLDKFVSSLNNKNHSSFKNRFLTPNLLHMVKQLHFLKEQFYNMYAIKPSVKQNTVQLLKIGDHVRIPSTSRTQEIFFKGYKVSNTGEIFRIKSINKNRKPYTYKLEDYNGEPIIGSFYRQELTPTILKNLYPINILKKKKNSKTGITNYLISYQNWPDSYNEWVTSDKIENV